MLQRVQSVVHHFWVSSASPAYMRGVIAWACKGVAGAAASALLLAAGRQSIAAIASVSTLWALHQSRHVTTYLQCRRSTQLAMSQLPTVDSLWLASIIGAVMSFGCEPQLQHSSHVAQLNCSLHHSPRLQC